MRRLITHIYSLPRESAFARSRNGSAQYWWHEQELLAAIVDKLSVLNFNTAALQGQRLDEPGQVPRPWDDEPEIESAGPDELNEFLRGGGF